MTVTLQIKYSDALDKEYLAFLKKCGYEGVELLLDGDIKEIEAVNDNIKSAGLYVSQTEISVDNIDEGLEASSQLGVKWACLSVVINYDTDKIRNAIPLAEKYGVGIALENPATHDDITDTFCIYADSFKSEMVGVCYNIGHGNLMGSDDFGIKKFDVDKADAIRRLGNRIKIIHANDNHGDVDRKLCPTVANAVCSVKWKDIITALQDIGFDGAFSLVCPCDFGEYDLKWAYAEFCTEIANALLGKGADR